MKKLLAVILALAMAVAFTACGSKEDTFNENVTTGPEVQLTDRQREAVEGADTIMTAMVTDFADMKADLEDKVLDYAKTLGRKYSSATSTKASVFAEILMYLNYYEDYPQRETIYVAGSGDYHYISFVMSKTEGDSADIKYINLMFTKEGENWKIHTNDVGEEMNEAVLQAYSEKFNYYMYDAYILNYTRSGNFAFKNPEFVPENAVKAELLWAVQEENGNLTVEVYIANGTGREVVVKDIEISLTDKGLGDIYTGLLDGGRVKVPAGTSVVANFVIPADKVATGLEPWGTRQSFEITGYTAE